MKEYNKQVEDDTKRFKLTAEDLHNLYDLFCIVDDGALEDTLKLNKMDKWFFKFQGKV